MAFVVPIVEGQGEVKAVRVLLQRIACAVAPANPPAIGQPIRVKASSFLRNEREFVRFVELAAGKAAQAAGVVLILLDCEDDCPATLGPELQARARQVRSDVEFIVALAYREYETWFLAAAESLRGCAGLPDDLCPPPDPHAIRGAKEWLGRHMPTGYDPIDHQAKFTASFDLGSATAIPSFGRLVARLEDYLRTASGGQA